MLIALAETTLIASVLALLAAVLGAVPRVGPAVRHALWLVVLIKLLTPPVVPGPRLPCQLPPLSGDVGQRNVIAEAAQVLSTRRVTTTHLVHLEREPVSPRVAAPISSPVPDLATRLSSPVRLATQGPAGPDPIDRDVVRAGPSFSPLAQVEPRPATAPNPSSTPASWAPRLETVLLGVWLFGGLALAARQLAGVWRFRARLALAEPPPLWLEREGIRLAGRLGVRCPPIRILAGGGSPLLWCLGPTVLLIPGDLLTGLARERWQGILLHELAHVRRGDAWVGRLLLVAGWIWWWNPLFWLVRSRLECEAELACDASVVAFDPGSRRGYAESLIDVCALGSPGCKLVGAVSALGSGAGRTGRFLERRLTMIVRGERSGGLTRPWKWVTTVAALLAVPAWSVGQDEGRVRKERAEQRARREAPEAPEPPEPPGGDQAEPEAGLPQRFRIQIETKREEVKNELEEVQRQRRAAVEEVRRAEAQLRKAQAELRQRSAELRQDVGKRARDVAKEARRIRQERTQRAPDAAPEEKARGEKQAAEAAARVQEELAGVQETVQNELKQALDQVRDELKKAMEDVKNELGGGQGKVQDELNRALGEIQRAQGEVLDAQGHTLRITPRIRFEGRARRLEGPPIPDGPGEIQVQLVPEAPRPPAPPGMVAPEGVPGRRAIIRMAPRGPAPQTSAPGSPGLERRIDALEKRFDSILQELKTLRQELKAVRPSGGDAADRDDEATEAENDDEPRVAMSDDDGPGNVDIEIVADDDDVRREVVTRDDSDEDDHEADDSDDDPDGDDD